MPDMEQIVIKGAKVWDDTKRLAFLQDMVDTQILPKLRELEDITFTTEEVPVGEYEEDNNDQEEINLDNVPF